MRRPGLGRQGAVFEERPFGRGHCDQIWDHCSHDGYFNIYAQDILAHKSNIRCDWKKITRLKSPYDALDAEDRVEYDFIVRPCCAAV